MIKAADVGPKIGAQMRAVRKSEGLTIAEVARRMGTHRPIVGRMERGIHDQSIESIVLYARACGRQPTAITHVLDERRVAARRPEKRSPVEDDAACMMPEEISGSRAVGHETHAASSSSVEVDPC